MNFTATLIMWGCLLPLLPILYVTMRNETRFKKNIAVGVTLPYAAREDAEVAARLQRYRRELALVIGGLGLVCVPCLFIRSFRWAMFAWGVWLLLLLILPYVPYVRCNRALHAIKVARGWKRTEETLRIDTAAIPAGRRLSPAAYLPAALGCLLPLLWDRTFWLVYIISFVLTAGCWAASHWLYRNRSETADDNAALSQTLTRLKQRYWSRAWLLCAYFLAAAALLMAAFPLRPELSLALLLVLSVLLVAAAVALELRLRQLQEKLTAQSGRGWYPDDDDKWIWGLFYYNPSDSRLVVNARIGVNTTVNLAKRSGKLLMAAVLAALLVLPFMGFLIEGGMGKDIGLSYEAEVLTARHGRRSYEAADIESVELLDALPKGLVRVMGTGTPNLLKGDFRAAELGNLKVCLDPTCPPFLLVESGGQLYLFGTRDAAVTEAVYRAIG